MLWLFSQHKPSTNQEIIGPPLSSQPYVLPSSFFPPFNGHSVTQRREQFSSPFSADLVLTAAQLLDPSEGAARNGQLCWEKEQNFHFDTCLFVDYVETEQKVRTYILGRDFLYFSNRNTALYLLFSLTFFFPPILCHHLLPAFPASYPTLFKKPISSFVAVALLLETSFEFNSNEVSNCSCAL